MQIVWNDLLWTDGLIFVLMPTLLVILGLLVLIASRHTRKRAVLKAEEILRVANESLSCSPKPSQEKYLDPDTIKAAQRWASSAVGYKGDLDGQVSPKLITALVVASRFEELPTQFENIVPVYECSKPVPVIEPSRVSTPWLPYTPMVWGQHAHPVK